MTQGRAVLQRVLQRCIVFTPGRIGHTFSAPTRFDKLFAGEATPGPAWLPHDDPRGTEHIRPTGIPSRQTTAAFLEQAGVANTKHQKGASPDGDDEVYDLEAAAWFAA
jgi:hypothetical protein